MTKRKRTVIGNTLVFAAIVIAVLIYCRPVSLMELSGTEEFPAFIWVRWEVAQEEPPHDRVIYEVRSEWEIPAAQEALETLFSTIRVRRGPLNWLGSLYPSTGHILQDTPWYMEFFTQDGSRLGSLHYYGGYQFDYNIMGLDVYLPCYMQNADEICTMMDTIFAQYGYLPS